MCNVIINLENSGVCTRSSEPKIRTNIHLKFKLLDSYWNAIM